MDTQQLFPSDIRYVRYIQTSKVCLTQYALKYELRKNTKVRSLFSLAIIICYAILGIQKIFYYTRKYSSMI